MDTRTEPSIDLGAIREMIDGRARYHEDANTPDSLCLLSLAYSAERIAAALERIAESSATLGSCVDSIYDHGKAFKTYETYR